MFKKLDKLVIKSFIGPFAATFFVILLVLVIQFFWLWIDEFVGKGLSTGVILEFIGYQSAVLVPLALPLAVMLSAIMTFGNMGESYELVAIKSAGISLLRFMRPLFFVVLIICYIAFLFANNIIPVANFKSKTLLSDIVYAKPAFDLKEGVFYDKINGFSIKIGKKQNDSLIKDIVIYEQGNGLQDNFIVAKEGVMRVTENKRFLEFYLKDGWRYQEQGERGSPNTEFIRLGFKEFKKQFDLSFFQFQRTSDSAARSNWSMLSMRQLSNAIDSMERNGIDKKVNAELVKSSQLLPFIDSIQPATVNAKKDSFDKFIPDSIYNIIEQRTIEKANSLKILNEGLVYQYNDEKKVLRRHEIEWHRKISLSVACLILFMIGAPLGSIIRKGGLGNSVIASIVFFMVFYFLGTTGEKFAKTYVWSAFWGMWFSTMVLIPIGLFLTYKALHDSQLLNKDIYVNTWKRFRLIFKRK